MVAQQIQTIQRVIAEQLETFVFEGTEILTVLFLIPGIICGSSTDPDNTESHSRTVGDICI